MYSCLRRPHFKNIPVEVSFIKFSFLKAQSSIQT